MKPLRPNYDSFSSGSSPLLGLCLVLFALCANASEELVASNATGPSSVVQLRSASQVDGEGVFVNQLIDPGIELLAPASL